MATLRQIQLAELDCLKEIDRVCKENHISYSLAYGTMLGAVRHKGFIPWDDDLDIYMNLREFRRFQGCFHSKGFFLQTPTSDPEMPFILYKLRKNGTKMIEKGMESLNMHQGVWVDIFLYVDSARNPIIKKLQHKLTEALSSYRCRTLNKNNKQENTLQRFANKLPVAAAVWIDKSIVRIIEALGSKNSDDFLIFQNGTFRSMHRSKKLLGETREYAFEDGKYSGIKDYNAYLMLIFGKDYMTPKRVAGHTDSYDNVLV